MDGSTNIKFRGDEGRYGQNRIQKSRLRQDLQKTEKKRGDRGRDDNPEETAIKEKFAEAKKKSQPNNRSKIPSEKEKDGEISLFDLSKKKNSASVQEEEMARIKLSDHKDSLKEMPFDIQQRQLETLSKEATEMAQGPSRIHKLIEKMVKRLTIMETTGRNETSMTIKNSATFEGTRVLITEFNSAKGEFNLTFENLTQQGKNLLDAHQNTLKMGLEQKGYVVHMITTTTLNETPEIGQENEFSDRNDQNDQEPQEDEESEDKYS